MNDDDAFARALGKVAVDAAVNSPNTFEKRDGDVGNAILDYLRGEGLL